MSYQLSEAISFVLNQLNMCKVWHVMISSDLMFVELVCPVLCELPLPNISIFLHSVIFVWSLSSTCCPAPDEVADWLRLWTANHILWCFCACFPYVLLGVFIVWHAWLCLQLPGLKMCKIREIGFLIRRFAHRSDSEHKLCWEETCCC